MGTPLVAGPSVCHNRPHKAPRNRTVWPAAGALEGYCIKTVARHGGRLPPQVAKKHMCWQQRACPHSGRHTHLLPTHYSVHIPSPSLPLRLAPLSEGRIEADGTLQCSYHGWRYTGAGTCTEIPQALDPKAKAVACSSSRSCVTSYPVQEAFGLIWVWPDAGPAAAADAAAAPLPVSKGLVQHWEAWPEGHHKWYRRELPYSFDMLLENLSDPCKSAQQGHVRNCCQFGWPVSFAGCAFPAVGGLGLPPASSRCTD